MSRISSAKTKHDNVRELLRRQLAEGRYPPGSRLPTETELPRILKAGKQTVVRALNDLVREGLIVRRRGDGTYVTDRKSPPLIPGRQLRIALLWRRSILPDRLLTDFQGAITRGVLDAWDIPSLAATWQRAGGSEPTRATWSRVERGVTVECIGEAMTSRERHPELDVIKAGRFDGLMTLSIIEEPWLGQLLNLGIPTILVDFLNEPLAARADSVYVDPLPGYRAAVSQFIAQGLKRIHFVGGYITAGAPSATMSLEEFRVYQKSKQRVDPDSYLRLSAWRQALDEHGVVPHEDWVHFAWYSPDALREVTQKMLALPQNQRPQAVLCHSLTQAQMLMEQFAEHGVLLHAAGGSETLAGGPSRVIHIDGRWLGEAAAALLISRLQQPQRPTLRVGVPMRYTPNEAVRGGTAAAASAAT